MIFERCRECPVRPAYTEVADTIAKQKHELLRLDAKEQLPTDPVYEDMPIALKVAANLVCFDMAKKHAATTDKNEKAMQVEDARNELIDNGMTEEQIEAVFFHYGTLVTEDDRQEIKAEMSGNLERLAHYFHLQQPFCPEGPDAATEDGITIVRCGDQNLSELDKLDTQRLIVEG